MNRLTIIGNLTRAPELRTTQSGKNVCSFTVAVNRRGQSEQADFFRVNAWEKLAETCHRYLDKGRKVAVIGQVSVSTYQANDGSTRAQMEVTANEVEFLSPQAESKPIQSAPQSVPQATNNGYLEITDEDLPF